MRVCFGYLCLSKQKKATHNNTHTHTTTHQSVAWVSSSKASLSSCFHTFSRKWCLRCSRRNCFRSPLWWSHLASQSSERCDDIITSLLQRLRIFCLCRSRKQPLAAVHVSGVSVIKDFQYVQVSKLSGGSGTQGVCPLKKKMRANQEKRKLSCNHSMQVVHCCFLSACKRRQITPY